MLTKLLGNKGEREAIKFLIKKGYTIVTKNFRRPWGEIDIVAKDPSGILVFVEVKTVSGEDPLIQAEEQFTRHKYIKLKRVVDTFVQSQHFSDYVNTYGCRLDLVALTFTKNKYSIRHYENVFL